MMYYLLLTLAIVIFTSIAHVILKKGALCAANSKTRLYTHPYSIIAYVVFAIVAFASIYAMKGIDLKEFFALNSLTYMVIPVLSFVFLRESITRNKLVGIILITIGVIIFNF